MNWWSETLRLDKHQIYDWNFAQISFEIRRWSVNTLPPKKYDFKTKIL